MDYLFYTTTQDFSLFGGKLKPYIPQYGTNSRTNYSGNGYIQGELKVKGVVIQNGLINLYAQSTNLFVASTKTDEFGKYRFNNIDENLTYFIVAIEPSTNWEYRVQSRILPAL